MALRDYLAGEVVEDFAGGFITRRDAIRRLVVLGLSLSSASTLLAACGRVDDSGDEDAATDRSASASGPTSTTSSSTTSSSTTSSTTGSRELRIAGPAGQLIAAFAEPTGSPKGAVLVIHENGGLTDHFRTLVGEVAAVGHVTLCVDLVSRAGGTAGKSSSAVQGALGTAPVEDLVADLEAGIAELEQRAPASKIGVVGFCFGGGMTWNLLAAGEKRLAAAVPFYGPAPDNADFSRSKAAVLAIYAELDARVNASRELAAAALERAGLTYEVRTFRGVDHAFFNPTGRRYNEQAASEARAAMLAWFDRHL